MTTQTISSSAWLKQIPPSILQMDEAPLFGNAPSFPWSQLGVELSRLLQVQEIKFNAIDMQWRVSEHLLDGIGSPCFLYSSFAPLEGTLGWVMPKGDIETLMQLVLTKHPEEFSAIEPEFFQTFYKFLAAQAIQIINKLDFDKNLSPSLHEENLVFNQPCFCIDVEITLPNKTLHGRVIIPNELRQSWKERYADRKLGINPNSPLAQKLQVTVHLEVGKTELSPTELAQLEPGDFIVLDHCSFEPENDKGRIMMTINDLPMFRARLKQGSLKILEFPLYNEVSSPMDNNEEDDEFEDQESELEENESFDEEHSEEELSQEEEFTEESEIEAQEESFEEEEEEEEPAPKEQKAVPPPTLQKGVEKKEGFKPTDLPVKMVVEVGRIQLSVQKLMELQPGNILDLNIHPENGVDLVVNGRCIGKGELLKAGETLGVRILDIG